MLGKYRHVAHVCDEDDGRRTYDIYRRGTLVAQGFDKRRDARTEAKLMDAAEHARAQQSPD